MGTNESGKIKACINCKIVSDMLTSERIKAREFALDGGGIISKIMQLENESKIEFEHVHVKTRNCVKERWCSHEKQLML